MRMRGGQRKSSLAAGADIRTTGFVQVDASRPEKRPRCDGWSFAENSNPARDGEAAPEDTSRLIDTDHQDHHGGDKLEKEKSRVQNGEESTGNEVCQEEAPALVEEAEPKLRHFSRTRQQKSRSVAEPPAEPVVDNVKNHRMHRQHDCIDGKVWPIMGAAYHTIHHTTYRHNYGHYTIWVDWMCGTLHPPSR